MRMRGYALQTHLLKVINCEENLWISDLLFSSFAVHFPPAWGRINSLKIQLTKYQLRSKVLNNTILLLISYRTNTLVNVGNFSPQQFSPPQN